MSRGRGAPAPAREGSRCDMGKKHPGGAASSPSPSVSSSSSGVGDGVPRARERRAVASVGYERV